MPSLHDVTNKTKTILKWGGILVGIIIALVFLYRGILSVKELYFPTPPKAPTVIFGMLPKIQFPKKNTTQPLSYVVDTVTGKLPLFLDEQKNPRDRMNVYKITHSELTLLDLQNTKNHVAVAGFGDNGINIGENTYRFVKPDPLPKTLDIDIVDKNFTITSDFPFNQRVLAKTNLQNQIAAVNDTTSLLQTLGVYPSDLDLKKTKVQLLKLKNGILFSAENLSDAQILRVDYFQKNIEGFPIYYPRGIYSTMYFLVASGSNTTSDVILSNFYHQQVTTQSGTYPIKPVAKAYQELVEGQGHIAANFVSGNTIKIQDIYLSYFAADAKQDYLMPIYIFKGREDEFYAYVSAVDETWVQGAIASPTMSLPK